jgi:hypothetical protein
MNTEARQPDAAELVWVKSSYSGGNGGECLEVAAASGVVHIRDSKDHQGGRLTFAREEWAAFLTFATEL